MVAMLRAFVSALLALASVGLVAPPAGVAAPTPVACTNDCLVYGTERGFVSPVTTLKSGGYVTWQTLDGAHTATELPGYYTYTRCLDEAFGPGADKSVRFQIKSYMGSPTLYTVRYLIVNGQNTLVYTNCQTATALPGGDFLLEYTSTVPADGNPRGFLLVRP